MDLNEKFEIKSESLGDLFVRMENSSLIYDPYYQRNFVWDDEHQREFIRTILLGLPCPMIFVAEGEVDLETHIKYLHIIDGQQRMRTVEKYLSNILKVDGRYYKDLEVDEKLRVTKYQIGTVRLKYNPEQDIDEITEIFRRLNIGNYELTSTEKTLSKFSDNEFVFLSRLISNDKIIKEDFIGEDEQGESSDSQELTVNFQKNPFITEEFKTWAIKKDFSVFSHFFLNEEIYSIQQIKRNTNTKDVIDMIAIMLNEEMHARVVSDEDISNLTSRVLKTKNLIYRKFHKVSTTFEKIEIPEIDGFRKKKYLYLRSNAFSLYLTLLLNYDSLDDLDLNKFNENLKGFCDNLPEDYIQAAKNSTMDKKQRNIRHSYLDKIFKSSLVS